MKTVTIHIVHMPIFCAYYYGRFLFSQEPDNITIAISLFVKLNTFKGTTKKHVIPFTIVLLFYDKHICVNYREREPWFVLTKKKRFCDTTMGIKHAIKTLFIILDFKI